MFCTNILMVVFMFLGKGNKIKPVGENCPNKAIVYFTWGFGPFQICFYADRITIVAKTFNSKKGNCSCCLQGGLD